MSRIRAKNTQPEIILRKLLYKSGVRGYRIHWKKAPGKPDIVFVKRKIAIMVNGCFWHRCPKCNPKMPTTNLKYWRPKFERIIMRDWDNYDLLLKEGYEVLVVWECQLKLDPRIVAEEIKMEIEKG